MKCLLSLKEKFKALTGKEWKPGMQAGKVSSEPSTDSKSTSGSNLKEADILKKITEQGDKIRQLKTG